MRIAENDPRGMSAGANAVDIHPWPVGNLCKVHERMRAEKLVGELLELVFGVEVVEYGQARIILSLDAGVQTLLDHVEGLRMKWVSE